MTEHEGKAAEIAAIDFAWIPPNDGRYIRLTASITAALDEAVKAEKERCAKFAEESWRFGWTGREIADAIRGEK